MFKDMTFPGGEEVMEIWAIKQILKIENNETF